ncbi:MAG: hypothetical protein ACE5G1_10370 [bacterium]
MSEDDKQFEMEFSPSPKYQTHHCTSFRSGDWLIHKCPECDYELRDNWRTGELIIRNGKVNINHSGCYFPEEYADSFQDLS